MQKFTLHYVKRQTTVLQYALVLCLLLSIGLSIFSEWHNPSHVLQTDQHCALCLNAHNLDNTVPVNFADVLEQHQPNIIVSLLIVANVTRIVAATGNRDPPYVL